MLCTSCRRQLSRGAEYCGTCGTPVAGAAAPLELVLADQTRVPLLGDMTIGRAPGSTVVLADPSVSRVHARISFGGGNGGAARIEERTMARALLDDGQEVLALNEIFVGHVTHQSARYTIALGDRSERQSSSGIIAATGTGATGAGTQAGRSSGHPTGKRKHHTVEAQAAPGPAQPHGMVGGAGGPGGAACASGRGDTSRAKHRSSNRQRLDPLAEAMGSRRGGVRCVERF